MCCCELLGSPQQTASRYYSSAKGSALSRVPGRHPGPSAFSKGYAFAASRSAYTPFFFRRYITYSQLSATEWATPRVRYKGFRSGWWCITAEVPLSAYLRIQTGARNEAPEPLYAHCTCALHRYSQVGKLGAQHPLPCVQRSVWLSSAPCSCRRSVSACSVAVCRNSVVHGTARVFMPSHHSAIWSVTPPSPILRAL